MSVNGAFDGYQDTIDEDPAVLAVARGRREVFKTAFKAERDVKEVWSSGSLRRGTQLAPLHDLDLVVVYEQKQQPTWGQPQYPQLRTTSV
jgi:predicted nucleotidyltransferase